MNKFQYMKAREYLMKAFGEITPNGKVFLGFVTTVREMEKDKVPYDKTIIAMAGSIVDGLRYGNWPKVI